MNYKRGRVAVTLPMTLTPWCTERQGPALRGLNSSRPHGRIHVGHARTLLLGELVCAELGTPYHVRIDTDPFSADHFVASGLLDLMRCLQALQIAPASVYWIPMAHRPRAYYEERLGQDAGRRLWSAFKKSGRDYPFLASIADDAVEHHPSLMIRGQEFAYPEYSGFAVHQQLPRNQMVEALEKSFRRRDTAEAAMFAACGHERTQMFMPLIVEKDSVKLSKSATAVPWDLLNSVSPRDARRFLLATALQPSDPLSALDRPFSIDGLNKLPYAWDWPLWGQFTREQTTCLPTTT